ncbi:Signal peptidase I [Spironucleus salmonicida]|uniref:Signal peptidase complex catalytic subunit SEC11 n=1 Tax=Spironucleus salmonicida TaxID=348837 RepID=V6LT74_9EUKA|nr:Signal peptidase I [Spironucleus salmonicida]|eukprot:EST47458.1 Signal peptidase complex catalytic subunit SEC11 [Spironucleus salmonicida]
MAFSPMKQKMNRVKRLVKAKLYNTMICYLLSLIVSVNWRIVVYRALIGLHALATTSLYWHMMKFLTHNDIPMSVVLTGSMEPGFIRGDAVALYTLFDQKPVDVGDIVVWKMTQKPVPIVHRIIEKRIIGDQIGYITKGDANADSDVQLYDNGLVYIQDKDLMATGDFLTPTLGYQTLYYTESLLYRFYYFYNIVSSAIMGYYAG